MPNKIQWTNPSVKELAGQDDPLETIVDKTRQLVLDAMDNGWDGPPYDPFQLAELRKISVVPNTDIPDARIMPTSGNPEIEFNPNRSYARIRFSLAHEIAHTLFPDYKKSIHNRSGRLKRSDDWQIELLCNVSAAEILMPFGPASEIQKIPIKMSNIIAIKDKYHVSTEAALLRMIKITDQPVTMFSAAKTTDTDNAPYRIEYVVRSHTSTLPIYAGSKISSDSVLSECTAVGWTSSKRREKLFSELPYLEIECIGVSPYSGSIYPRVLAIIKSKANTASEPLKIAYVVGDATKPRGKNHKIIAHIANDKSKRWGRGFGKVISTEWPELRTSFVRWATEPNNLKLGQSHSFCISEDLTIFSMVAQHGLAASPHPKIRYRHLAKCLESLAAEAKEKSASVHMPRIGTGFAGGDWKIISELIDGHLVKNNVAVTVYDLVWKKQPNADQSILLDYAHDNLVTN